MKTIKNLNLPAFRARRGLGRNRRRAPGGFGMIEVMIAMALMSALAMGTASILTSQSKMNSQAKTYINTSVLIMELSHTLNDPTSLMESAAATAGKGHSNFLNCVISNPPPALQAPLLPIPAPKGQCIPVAAGTNASNNIILTGQSQNVLADGITPQFYDNNLQPCVPTSPGGTPACGIEAIASYTSLCPPTSPNNCQPAATVTITYSVQVAPGITLANHAIFPAFTGTMSESVPFQMTNAAGLVQGNGTANYIPVWTGSSTLGSTSTLYQYATVDPNTNLAANYYGVNTTTPTVTLDAQGGIRAMPGWPAQGDLSNVGYAFGINGDTGFFENNGSYTNPGAGDLVMTINYHNKFQVSATGNIALGAIDGYVANQVGISPPPPAPTVSVFSDPTVGDQNSLEYQLPDNAWAPPAPFLADFGVQRINGNGILNPGVDMILDATQSIPGTGHSWAVSVGANGTTPDMFAIQDLGTTAMTAITKATPYQNRLTIDGSGNANFTGTLAVNGVPVTAATSDRRLKTNIQPLEDSLDKITQLQGVTWDWKDPQTQKGTAMGFVAQDMEQVFPQVVVTRTDGYKAIDYPALIAPLTEAVKELDAKNTALAAQNAQLQQRLDRLEALVQQMAQARQAAGGTGPGQ